MLTLYKASSSSSDNDESSERIIPAGRPYITKRNGKLVMVRDKKDRQADIAIDLLGNAFAPKTRIIQRRSKSVEKPKGPLLIHGVPCVPQATPPVTYTAPIPQKGFGSMIPMPNQYPLPYYPGPGPIFALPAPPAPLSQLKPTKEEFEQLVRMDSHYKAAADKTPKLPPKENEKAIAIKTTVTIVKHVCANCGRLRSRKYHQEHPIQDGETPTPAFCRKCQRDASSTSESSDSSREKRKKEKKKGKKKKKVKFQKPVKEVVESSSEDESPPPKETKKEIKPKPAPAKVNEPIHFDPNEDYIIVEEEFEDEEEQRGRSRTREIIVVDGYDGSGRTSTPLVSQSFPRRAHSAAERQDRHHISRKPVRPPKVRESQPNVHRSTSVEHRRVKGTTKHHDVEYEEIVYPRKVPIHFVEEVIDDKPVTTSKGKGKEREEEIYPSKIPAHVEEVIYEEPTASAREHQPETEFNRSNEYDVVEVITEHRRPPSREHHRSKDYDVVEIETEHRGPPSQEYSIEERSTSTREPHEQAHRWFTVHDYNSNSTRSSKARRRRRRERAPPKIPPWEAPYGIHPENEDEVVVVTEKFEYRRPQNREHNEESRRRQEYVDKTTLDAPSQFQLFSPGDAAKYFQENWARDSMLQRHSTAEPQRKGYRRETPRGSSLSESEGNYEYTARVEYELPRAPTPPSAFGPAPKAVCRETQLPYPLSSESEVAQRNMARKGITASRRPAPLDIPDPGPGLSSSRSRSANVCEATGMALIPSPTRSKGRIVEVFSDEVSAFGISEKGRLAELGARHVSFKETPSIKSATGTASDRSSPTPKDDLGGNGWTNAIGSGWNDGDEEV